MTRRNVELKARYPDLQAGADIAGGLGATDADNDDRWKRLWSQEALKTHHDQGALLSRDRGKGGSSFYNTIL